MPASASGYSETVDMISTIFDDDLILYLNGTLILLSYNDGEIKIISNGTNGTLCTNIYL
jgi:hypothetical protein